MALKSYKPTTPSQRNLVIVDRTGLYRGKLVLTKAAVDALEARFK